MHKTRTLLSATTLLGLILISGPAMSQQKSLKDHRSLVAPHSRQRASGREQADLRAQPERHRDL